MKNVKVYLGLGANLSNPIATIRKACQFIECIPNTQNFECSLLYKTTPVSDIPQSDFINAVCRLETSLTPEFLFQQLNDIESHLGKTPKKKNAPRMIDIDILLYGEECFSENGLVIPHVCWKERLFVLKPMSDITAKVRVPVLGEIVEIDLTSYIKKFKNINNENVIVISEE